MVCEPVFVEVAYDLETNMVHAHAVVREQVPAGTVGQSPRVENLYRTIPDSEVCP